MSELRRFVWLNGPFGVGKTSVGIELARRLDAAILDPEELGAFLNRLLAPAARPGDFQDIPAWRRLTREACAAVWQDQPRSLVVPMTLVDHGYFHEVVGGLRQAGVPVEHYTLCASRGTIEARPRERAGTTEWTWRQIDRTLAALDDPVFGRHVQTDGRTVAEIAAAIEADLDIPPATLGGGD